MTTLSNKNTILPYISANQLYQLAIKKSTKETSITMSLKTAFFHTDSFPSTHKILRESLPAVLRTECYNDSDLPFNVEVKNTEIGHLFEHILLEYMCQIKIVNGFKKASFRGVTKWNWKKDAKGTYHISIAARPEDTLFFKDALEKSVVLLNTILLSGKSVSLGSN